MIKKDYKMILRHRRTCSAGFYLFSFTDKSDYKRDLFLVDGIQCNISSHEN